MCYFSRAISNDGDDPYIDNIIDAIKRWDFDVIVCRGISGIAMSAIIGHIMQKPVWIVRKETDRVNAHSLAHVEYPDERYNISSRYIIIDDCVDDGDTVRAIINQINEHRDGKHDVVGLVLYQHFATGTAEEENVRDTVGRRYIPKRRVKMHLQ